MRSRTPRTLQAVFLILALLAVGVPASADVVGSATFERLKAGLVGDWVGKLEGIDEAVEAKFYLVGNDSALVEEIVRLEKNSRMLTVYHLAGSDLRLTHFCSLENQPRLRATAVSETDGALEVEFALVDVTNLEESGDRFTHRMTVVLHDADHASVSYYGLFDGEETEPLTAQLERAR